MARATRVLADGLHFGEGPRWRDGRLWFSDFYDHAVKSVSPDGDVRVEFEIDDRPSGLGWTPGGDLLV
ncbi:MAG: gluconolactonase, partial [Microbacterium sp.]|nr:gluconolactonase [Microbacterium sp.]